MTGGDSHGTRTDRGATSAALRSWFDGFVGSEEERSVADAVLSVVEAAYTLKHTGKAKPLHDALYWLEAELNV